VLDQLVGREDDGAGAVAPWAAERQDDVAAGQDLERALRNGWPQNVAGQAFEAAQVAGRNALRRIASFYMIEHMKQLLVQVDEDTFRKLEQIAPAHSRRRSAFIRTAIQNAIGAEQERATAEAYRKTPDAAEDAWFDPRVWEPKAPGSRGRTRR